MLLHLVSPGAGHLRLGETFFLQPQEIALTDPDSSNFFQPCPTKPFVATPAALDTFGLDLILTCLKHLQRQAHRFDGLDYLQVFQTLDGSETLWFIEDGPGGAITALLPGDY